MGLFLPFQYGHLLFIHYMLAVSKHSPMSLLYSIIFLESLSYMSSFNYPLFELVSNLQSVHLNVKITTHLLTSIKCLQNILNPTSPKLSSWSHNLIYLWALHPNQDTNFHPIMQITLDPSLSFILSPNQTQFCLLINFNVFISLQNHDHYSRLAFHFPC